MGLFGIIPPLRGARGMLEKTKVKSKKVKG
jgi:hypothetical protein